MNRSLYLAGPISGLSYGDSTDWRRLVTRYLMPDIVPLSPLRGKEYLSKETKIEKIYNNQSMSTEAAITGRDRYDVMTRCDAVLVYLLGAEEVSIGTVIEVGWADAARKPIILVIEDEGNVHDHPMVRCPAAFRVSSLIDACDLANALLSDEFARKSQ